jgi:hypothetical protein
MSEYQNENKEATKQAIKEFLNERLDEFDKNVGRWVRRTFIAALLVAVTYFMFKFRGFKFPWE